MVLAQSHFWPVAIGFFGLGTGYFIWGGQALFGFPKAVPEGDKSMGCWGIWMPGFMQLITGVYLMVGLSWFPVYAYAAPLYMAALAFTAYGTHWLVLGRRRAEGASVLADGWMAIAFFFLSVLGILVFNGAGDIPVMILFIGLALIYLFEVLARFNALAAGGRIVGLIQFILAFWLMYLTFGVTLNFALGYHWWV